MPWQWGIMDSRGGHREVPPLTPLPIELPPRILRGAERAKKLWQVTSLSHLFMIEAAPMKRMGNKTGGRASQTNLGVLFWPTRLKRVPNSPLE